MIPLPFVLLPLVMGVVALAWCALTRRRVRRNGTEEDNPTFVARRAVLAFEGFCGLILAALLGAVDTFNLGDLMVKPVLLDVFALLVVPLLVAAVFPGIMRGKY